MRVRTIVCEDLDDALLGVWRRIVAAEPALRSPYFCPEYTAAVGSVRRDVRIGVIEDGGEVVGFFPFQRRRFGRGRPVGGPLSDHHGVVAPASAEIDAADLVRQAGLASFDFDHVAASQRWLWPFIDRRELSPIIDVSQGYAAYREARRAAGSKQILKAENLARRAEREAGPLRFEARVVDERALATLRKWKSEQCLRSGSGDVFAVEWTRALMSRLMATDSPDFAGVLSTLHIGDRLAAAHMGMRSACVWHYWFPSYENEFAKYSPGLLLLLRMAEAAPALGIATIDMGKGEMQYKDRLMSGAVEIGEGRIELPSLARTFRRSRRALEACAAGGGFGAAARLPLKVLSKLEHKRKFA